MSSPKAWPWRPRSGYPSVPARLFVLVLVVAIVGFIVLLAIFGMDPSGSDVPGG
jgi:hypothetical protein